MRIILTQNVPNLGSLGDEVAVKDGYARNFLLPQGMAMPASGKNARAIQHRRQYLDKQRQEAISAAQGEAGRVTGMEIVVRAKAGTGGRLFGSITNRDLQAAFAAQGLELDRKAIVLHSPVKTLGTFAATVRLHTDVRVEIEFRVEPSEIVVVEKPAAEGAEGEQPAADAAAGAATEGAAAAEGAPAAPEAGSEPAPAEAAPAEATEPRPDA
jgi:large subunit ribosomal protein L9